MLSELVRQLSEDASTALSSMHRPPHTKSDNSSATKSDNPSATKMQSYSAGNKTCVVQSAYDSGVATPNPVGTPCTVDTAVLNRQLAIARDTIERYERNRAVIQSTVQLAGEECRKKNKIIAEKDKIIAEKDKIITDKDEVITDKDKMIKEKDKIIEKNEKKIESLTEDLTVSASTLFFFFSGTFCLLS